TVRPRAIHLLENLKAVRDLKEQPVRDIADYRDERWWAGDLPDHPACAVTTTGAGPRSRVSKAHVPAPTSVPEAVGEHLRNGITNRFQEPLFTADFDEKFLYRPEEAERLRSSLRSYVEGPWSSWAERARPAQRARDLYDHLFELRQRLQRDSTLI